MEGEKEKKQLSDSQEWVGQREKQQQFELY